MPSIRRQNSKSLLVSCGDLAGGLGYRPIKEPIDNKVRRVMFLLLAAVVLAGLSVTARPQSAPDSGDSSAAMASAPTGQLDLTYVRPTQRTMARNYVFDEFGPYPIAGAAIIAGINQGSDAKDAFRTGSNSLLDYADGNVALEFIYSGPHSLIHRIHLNNAHGSPDPGPDQ